MCDKYSRPLSEILELPAFELEWSAICFSIDDDLKDPKKRKELLSPVPMNEMTNEDAEARFREEFN